MGPHFSVVGVGQEHGTRRGDADQRAVGALRDQALARSAQPSSGPGAVVGGRGSGPRILASPEHPGCPMSPMRPIGAGVRGARSIYRRVGCPNLLQRPRSGRSAGGESLIFRAFLRGRSGRGAPLQQIWTRPAPDRPRSPTRTTPRRPSRPVTGAVPANRRSPEPACAMRARRDAVRPASRRASPARHDPFALDPRDPTWRNASPGDITKTTPPEAGLRRTARWTPGASQRPPTHGASRGGGCPADGPEWRRSPTRGVSQ